VLDWLIPKNNCAAEEKYDTSDHRADPIVKPEEVSTRDDTENLSHEFRRVSMLEHVCSNQRVHGFGL